METGPFRKDVIPVTSTEGPVFWYGKGGPGRTARQVLKVEHVIKVLILNVIPIHGRTERGVGCVLARTVDAGGTRLLPDREWCVTSTHPCYARSPKGTGAGR